MAFTKKDDVLKKVYFLTDEKLVPAITEIKKSVGETNETIQVQLNIKGYENRKDPKMTRDIVFPYKMRRDPRIVIIGNENVQPIAEKLGCPFLLASEYAGKDKEKMRELAIKKYKYIMLCQDFNKGFVLREILKKKKLHFLCPELSKIESTYNNLLYLYRLKVRDWYALSFPIGHCEMEVSELVENAKYGIQFLADNLKKGAQNIKDCFIKRTTGPIHKIN